MSSSTRGLQDLKRQRPPFTWSRRTFLAGTGAVAIGLALDATELGRHDVQLIQHTLRIARLPEAFSGFRIVQVSDIHFEEYTEPSFLRLIIHRINHLAPDMVLLTGDFISRAPMPLSFAKHAAVHCAALLRELQCPQKYAVLGNHDNVATETVVHSLSENGIPVLVNRYVPIERKGQRFWLGGIDDSGTGHPILDLAIPRQPDGPVILMSHQPDFTDSIVRHPRGPLVDVVLAGHTHGGQVRLPFLGPLVLPPGGKKYVEGFFRFNRMQLYVNRGVGTVGLPVRFNCSPEITLFTLENDEKAAPGTRST